MRRELLVELIGATFGASCRCTVEHNVDIAGGRTLVCQVLDGSPKVVGVLVEVALITVISPLVTNVFVHNVFDGIREYPYVWVCRITLT